MSDIVNDLCDDFYKLQRGLGDDKFTVMVTDANLEPPGPIIIHITGHVKEITGYEPEELIGKSPRVLQGPQSDHNILSQLKSELKRGNSSSGHVINYRKDGTPFTMAWSIAPIKDDDDQVLYFLSIQVDGSNGMAEYKLEVMADKIISVKSKINKVDRRIRRSAGRIVELLEQAINMDCGADEEEDASVND